MMKCPFCQFENEEGALFCEQCKQDLGFVEPAAAHPGGPVHEGFPIDPLTGEPNPFAFNQNDPPMAEPVDENPFAFGHEEPPMAAPVAAPAPKAAPAPPRAPLAFPRHQAAPVPQAMPVAQPIPMAQPMSVPEAIPVAQAMPVAQPVPMAQPMPMAQPVPMAHAVPAAAGNPGVVPPDAKPRLVVLRGLKINVEYPIYEGLNFIGRADEKPVDIDLDDQEPADRIWSSRQHALISLDDGMLSIEDLNSSNGTFVNRTRIYPGQKRPMSAGDIVQIGTVQMKLKF